VASFFLIRAHPPSLRLGEEAPVKDRFRGDAKREKVRPS